MPSSPGFWTSWHGKRGTKANPVEGEFQLFGFLTTKSFPPIAFGEHPLSRAIVECNDLMGATVQAMPLLEIWSKHGATHARVLNLDGIVAVEVRLEHAHAG